jgi:ABC-type transporter Mla subunit MlaD
MAGKLEVVFGLVDKEFQAGIGRIKGGLNSLDSSVNAASGRFSQFGAALSTVGAAAGAAALAAMAATIAFTTKELIQSTKEFVRFSDEISDAAAVFGVSEESLVDLAAAARLAGKDFGLIDATYKTFSKSIDKGAAGVKLFEESFKTLGVSVRDSQGNVKDINKLFYETSDALAKMKDGPEKAALGLRLFGARYQDLNEIIDEGSKGLDEAAKASENMGTRVTAAHLKMGANVEKNWNIINEAIYRFRQTIAVEALPAVDRLTTKLAEFAQSGAGKELGQALGGALRDALDQIDNEKIEAIAAGIRFLGEAAIGSVTGITEFVAALGEINTAWESGATGIESLVRAFDALNGSPFLTLNWGDQPVSYTMEELVTKFQNLGTAISEGTGQLATDAATAFAGAWEQASTNVITALTPVVEWFATLGQNISNTISQIDVVGAFTAAFTPLVAAAQQIVADVTAAFQNMSATIASAFGSIAGAVSSAIESVKATIDSWISWLGQKATEAAAAIDAITGARSGGFKSNYLQGGGTPRSQPFGLLRSMEESFAAPFAEVTGGDQSSGLIGYITSAMSALSQYIASANAAADATTRLGAATSTVQSGMAKVATATTAAGQAAQQAQSSFQQLGEQVVGAIGNAVGGFLDAIINKTKSVKDAFKDMVKQILTQLAKLAVNWIFQSLFGGAGGGLMGGGGSLFSSMRAVTSDLNQSISRMNSAVAPLSGVQFGYVRSPVIDYSALSGMAANGNISAGGAKITINNLSSANIDFNVMQERDEIVIEAAVNRVTQQALRGGFPLSDSLERTYGLSRVR